MIFSDPEIEKFFELITDIHFKYRKIITSALKENNITYPQMSVLYVLSKSSREMTQTNLAYELKTDSTNIMVICDSLEKKQLITRLPKRKDRRSNIIDITEKGEYVFKKSYSAISESVQCFDYSFSIDDVKKTLPILEKMYNSLYKIP